MALIPWHFSFEKSENSPQVRVPRGGLGTRGTDKLLPPLTLPWAPSSGPRLVEQCHEWVVSRLRKPSLRGIKGVSDRRMHTSKTHTRVRPNSTTQVVPVEQRCVFS